MKKTKNRLWDRNFTLITVGTIVSSIGGVAMNIAMSLIVFDTTNSTALTGLYAFLTSVPSFIIPLLISPYIDSHSRKKMIVILDLILALCYLIFAYNISQNGFIYYQYVIFGIISSLIGSTYYLAYQALYPNLINKDFIQKGYAVSSMIYPTIAILVTPFTAVIYTKFDITYLFMVVGILIGISAIMELFIKVDESNIKSAEKFSLTNYLLEIKEGYNYLKKDKGVLYLYANLSIVNGAASGNNLMEMTYFQTSPLLTTVMYSLLISAETLGRTLGAIYHYLFKIPNERKYDFTKTTYLVYDMLDGLLLFMPYGAMIISKFVCGFLGINSATLRESALQMHLPDGARARINSFVSSIISFTNMSCLLVAGILAEIFPYRMVAVFFTIISLSATYFIIGKHKKEIAPILNTEFE